MRPSYYNHGSLVHQVKLRIQVVGGGDCTPKKLACFVLYLKIINT